jgi:hypothetical protein
MQNILPGLILKYMDLNAVQLPGTVHSELPVYEPANAVTSHTLNPFNINYELFNVSSPTGFQTTTPFSLCSSDFMSKVVDVKYFPQLSHDWTKDNVALLSNGICTDACGVFMETLHQRLGVPIYTYGPSPPLQASSSWKWIGVDLDLPASLSSLLGPSLMTPVMKVLGFDTENQGRGQRRVDNTIRHVHVEDPADTISVWLKVAQLMIVDAEKPNSNGTTTAKEPTESTTTSTKIWTRLNILFALVIGGLVVFSTFILSFCKGWWVRGRSYDRLSKDEVFNKEDGNIFPANTFEPLSPRISTSPRAGASIELSRIA